MWSATGYFSESMARGSNCTSLLICSAFALSWSGHLKIFRDQGYTSTHTWPFEEVFALRGMAGLPPADEHCPNCHICIGGYCFASNDQAATCLHHTFTILNNKACRASQLHHTTAEQLDLCMCIGTTALGCQALYMI